MAKRLLSHITRKSKTGKEYYYDKRAKKRISKKEYQKRRKISSHNRKKQKRKTQSVRRTHQKRQVYKSRKRKTSKTLKFKKTRFVSRQKKKRTPIFAQVEGYDYRFRMNTVFNREDFLLETGKLEVFIQSLYNRTDQVIERISDKKWTGFHTTLLGVLLDQDGGEKPLVIRTKTESITRYKGEKSFFREDLGARITGIVETAIRYEALIFRHFIISIRKEIEHRKTKRRKRK